MANIRRNTRPAPRTLGSMLPTIAGGIGGAAVLWAVFTVALGADKAVAEAAAAVEATTTVQTMSGGLTARRLACAEEGIGC